MPATRACQDLSAADACQTLIAMVAVALAPLASCTATAVQQAVAKLRRSAARLLAGLRGAGEPEAQAFPVLRRWPGLATGLDEGPWQSALGVEVRNQI